MTKIKNRIIRLAFILTGLSIILTSVLISVALYQKTTSSMKTETRTEAQYIKVAYEMSGRDYLEAVRTNTHRLTLIDKDGYVLFDNESNPQSMENHLDRVEIKQAMEQGEGETTRLSKTLRKNIFYYALRLKDGNVLRVAITVDSALKAITGLIPLTLLIALAVFLLSALLASREAKRIVNPINNLNLEKPEENVIYDELNPLLNRLKQQNNTINKQIDLLQKKQSEFAAITSHMSEGFLVIDDTGNVLLYNNSVFSLMGISNKISLNHVLEFNRSGPFRNMVEKVLKGKSANCILLINGRYIETRANPVMENSVPEGAVLVFMDITESQQREQLRREFSANVSHELKTPITTISGYAELIENGVATAQDVPKFAKIINEESARLISLINDIIKISQLDEQSESYDSKMQAVNLNNICNMAVERYQSIAQEKKIKLTYSGQDVTIIGVDTILKEIAANLIENSLKYTLSNGQVSVKVEELQNHARLTVSDNGIGISPKEQNRIFERFYRADKSHSSVIRGTGLGLSIVKHGVALHGAKIDVNSNVGKGTTVIVDFPKTQN